MSKHVKSDIGQTELERINSEWESTTRKLRSSRLINGMLAGGAEMRQDDNFPKKQARQMYRAQMDAHNGSDDIWPTRLGYKLLEPGDQARERRQQLTSMINKHIKHSPDVIAQHLEEFNKDIFTSRGAMDVEKYIERFLPYVDYKFEPLDPQVEDLFVECCVRVFNRFEDSMGGVITPLSNYMEWVSQFAPGANSGSPLYESLTKEQWANQYIPDMMEELIAICAGNKPEGHYSNREYVMFARTPDRPIHGVHMLGKAAGSFLNYDLTQRLGVSGTIPMSWTSLEEMFEDGSRLMANVETTIHEDFSRYDSRINEALNRAVLKAFDESRFLRNDPARRNVYRYLLEEMCSPTDIRISNDVLMKMRGSLYSGTPITQIHGSIIHAAYLECLRESYGVGIHDYRILSDDGMTYYEGNKASAERDLKDHFIPFAAELNLVMNDKKSYIADLTRKKVMLNSNGEKLIRHDVGPYLSKFIQRDADESFGNLTRLTRSLLGKERETERDTELMLFQLLPGLRSTAKGDRNLMRGWVQDFWRMLEVMAQIRPGYPRRREFIKTIVGLYGNFWNRFDILVKAAASTGDVLFDTPTVRGGGTSEKGTVRWLVAYLMEYRETGKWPL